MAHIGLYRAMLRCYPAPFRQEYGPEMIGAFTDQVREARQAGGWRAETSIWFDAIADLFVTAPQEHYHVIKQDLRYAFRSLASQPTFAAVAILSLGLGIGANTAIFSLLNAVVFSSLPVRDPQSLVMLTDPGRSGVSIGSQSNVRSLLTYAEFAQLRDQSNVFSELMASQSVPDRLPVRIDGGDPEEATGRLVSAEFFSTLGASAVLGRTFSREDDLRAPYAVISYDYWQRRFGGRADILDTRIAIRQGVFSIVGVAPASFFGETVGERPDIWLPLTLQPVVLPGRDWLHDQPGSIDKVMWLRAFGRLRSGVTLEQAQAAVNVVFQQGLADFYGATLSPEAQKGFLNQRIELRSGALGASSIRGQFADPLTLLLAAAGVVLVIACANLGNLLLTRTAARTREISVRLALGAGRGRIIRQLLTESMAIAFLGGVAGIAAASMLRAGLLNLAGNSIDLRDTMSFRVLGFAFLLTLASGAILGLLPAMRTKGIAAGAGLKEQGRGLTGSATWMRAGKFVAVGQVALSLPLLVGAGLLIRTLQNLQQVDLGYAKERLVMVRVDVQTAGYEEARRQPLFERLLDRVRAVPGVRAATYSKSGLFLGSDSSDAILVEGYTAKGGGDGDSRYDYVGPGFFSTLGIPLLLGREITERDGPSSNRVCVINEAFAKRFFADRNPIGMRITQVWGNERNTYEIVGVARNSRKRGLRDEIEHRFFVPVAQPMEVPRFITYAVRTVAEPSVAIAGVRRAILAENPNLPIPTARAVEDLVDERLVQDRMMARISFAFGAVALALAAIGLYGVLSYGVARRTNEIGIRKALGAQHGAVVAMILRETALLLAVGLAAGVALSAAGMRFVASRLYGLASTDPATIGVAIAVLAAVGLVAAWIPAYRASRVDPMVALRHE